MLSTISMFFTFALVISGPALSDAPEMDEPGRGPAVLADQSAEQARAECLEVDQSRQYEAGIFGRSGDDHYPMNGKTITRVDLQVDTGGHASAQINKQDSTEVVVHWWVDLFSSVSYTLKVWVEC
ncbi:hypothetical protein OV090_40035 [Nannocystis sp. RBIL2]|uniref:hypothetical protein n=1 Tax=Nannocystis sp. RBIL2 TaxID=2996788 RepID=UPI00227042DD|nr:hypothetical protein [Nannocystis sp. RBIL2]MCY1071000.1 hypothetical protein [Nannocystis sp. RBIL2]